MTHRKKHYRTLPREKLYKCCSLHKLCNGVSQPIGYVRRAGNYKTFYTCN